MLGLGSQRYIFQKHTSCLETQKILPFFFQPLRQSVAKFSCVFPTLTRPASLEEFQVANSGGLHMVEN